MGVDAIIYAVSEIPLSDREVLTLSVDLAEAVGPGFFSLDPQGRYGDEPRHALSRVRRSSYLEELQPPPEPGAEILEVNTLSRFYGEGYERGNFTDISAVCDWLTYRGLTVYYGSDSGGGISLWSARREKLWKHWAVNGGRPYREGFGQSSKEHQRICTFCDRPLTQNGWGAGFAHYTCRSCFRDDRTNDSGKTWIVRRGNEEIDPTKERCPFPSERMR